MFYIRGGLLNLADRIEKILGTVQKPTRYLGGEWNASVRSWDDARLRVALGYPDVYEVGQSHLGLRILYGLINDSQDFLAERFYAPWPDMEGAMRREGIPLFSLESWRPVRDFDLLGFSLQYELTYSNILGLIALAGLPLRARERGEGLPLVVGGGPCAYNPEPLADFFDLFFLGEAEEGMMEILAQFASDKAQALPKKTILAHLAAIPGVYVPSLYDVSYNGDGTVSGVAAAPGARLPVRKRLIAALDKAYFPSCFVVPHQEIVHDRGMVEILRGCTHGCRFCQAGMVYRPVRTRSAAVVEEQADALLAATGFEEVTLTSLSSTDHPEIGGLLQSLLEKYRGRKINVSLPSLRADRFSLELAERMQGSRKTSLTFAPEAGSQRLRQVINKDLTEEEILATAEAAFAGGWERLKLYFMIGLPGETEADLEALASLAKNVLAIGRRYSKRAQVTVSISTFVSKAHTPFQWRAQLPLAEIKSRQSLLQNLIKGRGLELQWHQAEQSVLEGVFARGDRKLGAALEEAYRLGCRFDGWSEWFDYPAWQRAFTSAGIDPAFYASRRRDYDETLPWDHLDTGVDKAFLIEEDRRAERAEMTGDCRDGICSGCGVCTAFCLPLPGRGRV
ncbi:MAG: TIGR03960 family B12-binding radical SAM protein [Bacteroidota bacterium]